MAKPNYNYEKRQRDLAKKKKKEEKLKKKQAAKGVDSPDSQLPSAPDVDSGDERDEDE